MKRYSGLNTNSRRGDQMKEGPSLSQDQACRNLLAAVIHQAADDMHPAPHARPSEQSALEGERNRAKRWVTSLETRPFSFDWCCTLLDMNPERMRVGILERVGA